MESLSEDNLVKDNLVKVKENPSIKFNNEEYFVRNFDDYEVSTVTSIIIIKGEYELLPLMFFCKVNIDMEEYGFITDLKYRYLENEEYKMVYRCEYPDKIFPNGISGSFSIRNIKFKIFTNKVNGKRKMSVIGHKSPKEGKKVVSCIVNQINDTNSFIHEALTYRKLFKKAYMWLLENSVGENIITNDHILTLSSKGDNQDDIDIYKKVEDNMLNYDIEPPKEIEYFVFELMERTKELKYVSELRYRLKKMRNVLKTLKEKLSISVNDSIYRKFEEVSFKYKVVLEVRNYSLGFEIGMKKIYDILNENPNFICNFFNQYTSCPKAYYFHSDDNEIENLYRRESKEKRREEFKINRTGKIIHRGVGGKRAKKVYELFMDIIVENIDFLRT